MEPNPHKHASIFNRCSRLSLAYSNLNFKKEISKILTQTISLMVCWASKLYFKIQSGQRNLTHLHKRSQQRKEDREKVELSAAEPQGRGRKNEEEDGDRLIGKWIGDRTSQLAAKIRIPSVLNEIFNRAAERTDVEDA